MKIEQQPIYQIKRFLVSLIGLARAILKSLEIGEMHLRSGQRWLRVLHLCSSSWARRHTQQPSLAIVIRQQQHKREDHFSHSLLLFWHKGSSIGNLLTHSISLSFSLLHSLLQVWLDWFIMVRYITVGGDLSTFFFCSLLFRRNPYLWLSFTFFHHQHSHTVISF